MDVGQELVSCIVVTHRSDRPLRTLLRSICAHEPHVAVLVVDNATPEGAPSVPDHVEVLRLADNRGYGAACNVGVAASAANADCFAFLNPDLRFLGPTLTHLAREFAKRPDLGIATGPIEDQDHRRVASVWGPPSVARAFWAATGWRMPRLRATVGRVLRKGAHQSGASMNDGALEVEGHVLGGAMMVRRECFEQIGGFDESFFLYWEDADLCTRARGAGWKVMMLPAPPMVHVEGTSSTGVTRAQRWAWYRQGAARYAQLHLPPWRARALMAAMGIGERVGRSRG
jgi:N-acetylglucosaminyl-diphospho-decaprenol L-rhamnosyltransferase